MKLNDKTALDFIEQDILYCWGSASYPATLFRLNELHRITVDPDIKAHIDGLTQKLLVYMDQEHYEQLFYQIRQQLKNGAKGKLRCARELMEMELKKAT